MTETLEPGDWVCDWPLRKASTLCYEVRSIQQQRNGVYVLLRAYHIISKERFNCSSMIGELALIRKKDGRKISPPERCG